MGFKIYAFLFSPILLSILRVLVVINSLSRQSSRAASMCKELASSSPHDVEVYLTRSSGDAFRRAYQETHKGVGGIIACGGDGTLNEVINGVFNADPKSKIIFGHYPIGSANDLARTIGRLSLEDILNRISNQDFNLVDRSFILRSGKRRYFTNESTAGMGALVCRSVDNNRKTLPPSINFQLSSLMWVLRFQRPTVRVYIGEQQWEQEVQLLVVGKGCFVGNGLGFTPHANLADGKFGVTILEKANLWDLLRFRHILTKKRRVQNKSFTYLDATKIQLEVVKGCLPIETDGEFFEFLFEGEVATYRLDRESIRLAY